MFPTLSLVLGGVSSGKSAFAETLVLSADLNPVYLASAQAGDDEMNDKIARHRTARDLAWTTIEEPLDATRVLAERTRGDIVLFDCATLWMTNHLLAGHDLTLKCRDLYAGLNACACPVVIVSNEVGGGGIAPDAMQRQFQRLQGDLNRNLSQIADLAVLVTAGLPQALKGHIPGKLA